MSFKRMNSLNDDLCFVGLLNSLVILFFVISAMASVYGCSIVTVTQLVSFVKTLNWNFVN